MTFKIGDRVRVKREYTYSRHRIGNKQFLSNEGIVTEGGSKITPSVIMVDSYYVFHDAFELVSPPFQLEVGKIYKRAHTQCLFTIIGISGDWVWYKNNFTGIHVTRKLINEVVKEFTLYTPPPPEEWRIVYKNSTSIIIGVTPFTSDSEARASIHWGEGGFKTIRVDS